MAHQSVNTFSSCQALTLTTVTKCKVTSSQRREKKSREQAVHGADSADLGEVGPPTTERTALWWPAALSAVTVPPGGYVCNLTVLCRIHQIPIHGIRTALGISVLLISKEERMLPPPW